MAKWLRYVMRAMAIGNIIAVILPKIMADGKITVAEMAEFFQAVLDAAGWKTHIELPKDFVDVGFDVTVN